MKEPVIIHTNIKDTIILDDKFNYKTNMTIGLTDGGDFFIVIDFIDLTEEDLKMLVQLSRLSRRIKIKSNHIDKEQFKISYIVVTNIKTSSNLDMVWECLSDDPSLYDGLIIK